jgi:cell fate (sporulation/competence/biofilm development) regulator YmcA (YheA/YmcA/DUF963 family)
MSWAKRGAEKLLKSEENRVTRAAIKTAKESQLAADAIFDEAKTVNSAVDFFKQRAMSTKYTNNELANSAISEIDTIGKDNFNNLSKLQKQNTMYKNVIDNRAYGRMENYYSGINKDIGSMPKEQFDKSFSVFSDTERLVSKGQLSPIQANDYVKKQLTDVPEVKNKTVNSVSTARTGKPTSSMDKEMRDRYGDNYNYGKINDRYGGDQAKINEHLKGLGIDATNLDKAGIEEALQVKFKERVANPSPIDKMRHSKVPQAVAGIGATAWLVSRMSESKGQMSNSQLYSGGGY